MRNIEISTGVNWIPLKHKYDHDDLVSVEGNNTIQYQEGITLHVDSITKNICDDKINNHCKLQLTNKANISDIMKLNLSPDQFPEQQTTYLLMDANPSKGGSSKYIKIVEEASTSTTRDYILGSSSAGDSWYYGQDMDDNSIYFNITLHSSDEISISHNDNYATVYLTCEDTNGNVSYNFKAVNDNIITSDQKFQYIINKKDGLLVLYKTTNNINYYVTSHNSQLSAIVMSEDDDVYPTGSIINMLPYVKTYKNMVLNNNWVSYATRGDQNSLDVNSSKSYDNIYNNYLINTQYATITGDIIPVDITPLKNQLTSDYNQSRDNPFKNSKGCDHREYDKIFSGTNQIKGSPNIHVGYNSYTTDIILKPDTVTYFHTPQNMYPYKRININDSGLINSGAIGGSSPITSDKIFKKASDYKYNSPHGAPTDEETGVWLCSWLKANVGDDWSADVSYNKNILVNYKDTTYRSAKLNTSVVPTHDKSIWIQEAVESIWVDRYYNPEYYTVLDALKVGGQYSEYTSKFEYVVQTLSAQEIYVFDKVSDLCFEPGCMYAYYRIGAKENNSTIDSLVSNNIHTGINPTYTIDGNLYNNITEYLYLDGTKHIETTSLPYTKDSSFTLSMWLCATDWSEPLGSQIAGNYTNAGFGIFNRQDITPYIIIPTTTGQMIYNTDFDMIVEDSDIPIPGQAVHGTVNNNIHILTTDAIVQYDMKGLLVENSLLTDLLSPGISARNISIDNDNVYIIDTNESVYQYDINNEKVDQLFMVNPSTIIQAPDHALGDVKLVTTNNNQYRIDCDNHTIDMKNNIWFTKSGDVYKYTRSETTGAAAKFNGDVGGESVTIVAEEIQTGADGNSIMIVGDGSMTVQAAINAWNYNDNVGNKAQVIKGAGAIIPLGDVITLEGGLDAGAPIINKALTVSTGNIISIKCDYDNNIICLISDGTNTTLYKLDNDRNVLFRSRLGDISSTLIEAESGDHYMDMVTEFNETGFNTYVLILRTTGSDLTIIKIDLNGELISRNHKTTIPSRVLNTIQTWDNITNYETMKNLYSSDNKLTFKLKYQNYFDTDNTYDITIDHDIEALTSGLHHFAFTFDSTNSNIALYVDGTLSDHGTSKDATGAGYKYTSTVHTPMLIGVEPFFNNITLGEHLGQTGYHHTAGCSVSNVKIYNSAIDFNSVRALAREEKIIEPIKLTIPTGKRTFLDQATKFYRHRTPGIKSSAFNIDIISETLSGSDIRSAIEPRVRRELEPFIPANTKINKFNWS